MEETPSETAADSSMNKTWMMIAVAVVVVAVLGGGFYFLNQGKTVNAPATPTPTVGAMEISPTAMEAASPSGAMMEDKMAAEKKVSLTKAGYSPASITIKAGTKVTWTNNSGEDATVNSDPHPTHTNYPPLNLGKFSDGDSLSLTFDKPGTYGYHNHFKPSEKGTVIVQ